MATVAPAEPKPTIDLVSRGFDVKYVSHARSILRSEFAEALSELEQALVAVSLPITEIIGSGGGETKFTQRLRRLLASRDWRKHRFEIAKIVDGVQKESTSHEVDHVKRVAGSSGTTKTRSSTETWKTSSDCTPRVRSVSAW